MLCNMDTLTPVLWMQEAAAGASHRAGARFEALRLLLDVLLVLQVLPADPEGALLEVFEHWDAAALLALLLTDIATLSPTRRCTHSVSITGCL